MSVKPLVWIGIFSLFLLSIIGFISWSSDPVFVSPDENAAYVFAEHFRRTGEMGLAESLNLDLHGLSHPRSTLDLGGVVVPGSFVGLILIVALIGKLFGQAAMFLVTPFLAVIAVWLWRATVIKLFHDTKLGNLAGFLLLIHPAFWYYSGRVMMHNVAFLSFLIIGVWFGVVQPIKLPQSFSGLAEKLSLIFGGLAIGTALIIRTSEILWVIPGIVVSLLAFRREVKVRALLWFSLGIGAGLLALAIINSVVYGSPLTNGYTVSTGNQAELADVATETATTVTHNWWLPFGFNERIILHNVWSYGYKLYPWMSVLALVGMIVGWTEASSQKKIWRFWLFFTLGLAVWMALYYGSWLIVDNPDPKIVSLGNSHVRYWLPLFALASVFAAKTLVFMLGGLRVKTQAEISRQLPHPSVILRHTTVVAILAVCTLMSLDLVWFGQDGYFPNQQALKSFIAKREVILNQTEVDSILIVDRADKYLWPARSVVTPLRQSQTYAALPTMLGLRSVYYFGITLPISDINYLNTTVLPPLGARIDRVLTFQDESLYQFTKIVASD